MERLLYRLYKRKKLYSFMTVLSHISSSVTAAAFIFVLVYEVCLGRYIDAAVSLISGAVGYILVTLVRNIIDAPRPYEMYSFYESKPKSKAGRSFPSRHIYCSFATAGLLFAVHPLLFVGMLLFALVMCFCRVLLGIHFIRDAVTGALIGSVSGAIAALIILI